MEASTDLAGVRVCRFGHASIRYSRNRILAKALRRAGATVEDVIDHRPYPVRTAALLGAARRRRFDLLLVGYPGHTDVPAAVALGRLRGVPVILDAFLSLHDTFVEDRGLIPSGSLRARWPALVDRVAVTLPDLVLLDTEAHIAYFTDELGAPRDRFRRIWAGADDEVMRPAPRSGDPAFTVFLYTSFSPLHGVEQVVRAASALDRGGDPVRLRIAGDGQTYPAVRSLAERLGTRSIEFLGRRPFGELPGLMAEADVCLGIFGTTPKAARVIPNKVFDGLAVERPVITADTPAIREGLAPGRHLWTCPAGDPRALAEAISRLKADPETRRVLAAEGRRRFEEAFSIEAISRDLVRVVREVVPGRGSR
jgi:glycosyltransferase involved in cell wall biosynthesis